MGKLDGKVAVITGAGQGIGLGIAQTFSMAGANLVITGRDENKLKLAVPQLEESGAKVVAVPGDAAVRAQAQSAVEAAIASFGQLDVLVNNAQALAAGVLLEHMDEDSIQLTMGSGFYATLWHMLAALPHLKATSGSIINLGSRAGIWGEAGFAVYGAGKEAIRGLTRTAAREWGQYQVRVNVIVPMAWGPTADAFYDANPEEYHKTLDAIPLGRFGDPVNDIGPTALFLASEDSRYVTGQTINVNGGALML